MPLNVDQWRGKEVKNFYNWVAANFLVCTFEICSVYKKLRSAMDLLFLKSAIMFIQTIVNLLLLKLYYRYHSFRVANVLVSFSYLIIWYDLKICQFISLHTTILPVIKEEWSVSFTGRLSL